MRRRCNIGSAFPHGKKFAREWVVVVLTILWVAAVPAISYHSSNTKTNGQLYWQQVHMKILEH